MKIFYIAEFILPSNKAYSIHVFKMLDSFARKRIKTQLIIPYAKNKTNYYNLEKFYNLKHIKLIRIKSIFSRLKNFNFFQRFKFGYKTSLNLKNLDKKNIIITRSLATSVFFSLFKISHFVEMHQELKGLTKFLFLNLNFIKSKSIIKIIFISRALSNYYKNYTKNFIVLHDGVDLKDFKNLKKKIKKVKNITYTGSFYRGRGVEKIIDLAKKLPHINFNMYGQRNEFFDNLPKNIKIYKFIKHSKIPIILNKSDILILPYSNKVSINSENFKDDISKFTSPIKMFEYLASGTPIISSNLKVLREILKNKYNSILIKNFENLDEWTKAILSLSRNKKLMKKISMNGRKTAIKYSWDLRAKEYLNQFKKNN